MLVAPAEREYRSWVVDSRRWQGYRPRPDDIVIATYPKCGTTWMQRIVGSLVFQSAEPRPVMEISAWIDRRFGPLAEAVQTAIEAQGHRRFLKSHLPLDGLPFYDEVRYIHVGRDGRDAAMSSHNHVTGFDEQVLTMFDRIGAEDETVGRPYPRAAADPAAYFHSWVVDGTAAIGSFFRFQRSWWQARKRPNVLFVHYNDLQADLAGEMRRIAEFLEIAVADGLWPELVEAAGFAAMRRDGEALMGQAAGIFRGGSERFFHKGSNGRWRGVVRDEDLALYDRMLAAELEPACAAWIEGGRRAAGDPRAL